MSKVGQPQLHLAGAKQKWALVTDYTATSKITEKGFGEYSFYLSHGDLILLVISPFFFFPGSLFSCLFIPSCNKYLPCTVLVCATHILSIVNKTDNNA